MGTGIMEFRQNPGDRGLLLLGYFYLKRYENGLGSCKAGNGHEIQSQRKGTEYLVGTVLGQSTTCSGTALCSLELVVGLKFVHV